MYILSSNLSSNWFLETVPISYLTNPSAAQNTNHMEGIQQLILFFFCLLEGEKKDKMAKSKCLIR